MDVEEIAKKYCMRELKTIAKKYGIGTRCVKEDRYCQGLPAGGPGGADRAKRLDNLNRRMHLFMAKLGRFIRGEDHLRCLAPGPQPHLAAGPGDHR